jgi:regulation of enolase protein 1 (concanavalin A-like superfamily)
METLSSLPLRAALGRRLRGAIRILCGVIGFAPVLILAASPAAPTNVRATFVSDTRVSLGWADMSSDETGFQINRSEMLASGVSVVVGTVGANVSSFDDDTVRPGTQYYYSVESRRGTELSGVPAYGNISVTTSASAASQPNAPTYVQADGLTVNSLRLTWTDNSSDETRFDLFRGGGVGGDRIVFLASVPANTVSYQDSGLQADTDYYYFVRAVRGSVYSAFSSIGVGHTQPLTAVGGWANGQLSYGMIHRSSASGSPPNVTIQGAGDIWDTSDACGYYYRTIAGDATIVTRVASLTNTHPWAKAGAMIRDQLTGQSAQVSMLLTAGANAIFEVRAAAGATTSGTLGPWLSPPYWTKLTRVGNTFTGFISPDGSTWTQIGTANVSMPATIYVGVAASSHSYEAATAVFQNLATTGLDAPPPPPIPAAPTDLQVGGITASGVTLTWLDHANNEDGFKVYGWRGSAYQLVGTVAANVTRFDDTGLQADTHYQYYIQSFKGGELGGISNTVPFTTGGAAPAKPAAPRDLHPDSISATSTHLVWTDVSSDETQIVLERALTSAGVWPDAGAFAPIATLPANTISYVDTSLSPQTHYAYRIRSVLGTISSEMYGGAVVDTPEASNPPPPPPPPPTPWTGRDIGVTGSMGSDTGVPPTVTMNAGGADIYGAADGFHFMSRTITGDATIVARVASLNNTHSWAKAGVMIRATLDPNSANAAMVLSPDAPCSFQSRPTAGVATNVTTGAWVNPSYWVKLSRTGDTFIGYVSADGTIWTEVSRATLALPTEVYIGLVACSHTTMVQTVASFDFVEVSGADTPPPPPDSEWSELHWPGATTGSATVGDEISITTTSGDIYGQQDSGVFVFQPWSGPGEFVARVNTVGNSHPWAKAGFMLRAGLGSTAGNAFVVITADQGAVFQHRPNSASANTVTDAQYWGAGPGSWIKLVRGGGKIKAYCSVNGDTWISLGEINDDLPETLYAGFAASSHNANAGTTATFSGFVWPD